MRSKLHQSELKREQARAELSQAQRQLLNNLYGSYNDATVARAAVDESRHTAELAAESLRLIGLRYHAGASTALEVVSAEKHFDASAQCVRRRAGALSRGAGDAADRDRKLLIECRLGAECCDFLANYEER